MTEQTPHVNPNQPPVPAAQPVEPPLTVDEINALGGDLAPGEIGWVKLDEEGTPTGTASKEPPKTGDAEAYARVVGARPPKGEEVLTPSGAPITRHMNPDPQLWDAGMLARNPIPDMPPQEKKRQAAGQANPLVTGGNPTADTAHPQK